MPICSKCGSYCVRLPCPVCAQTDEERRGIIKDADASVKKWQISTRRVQRGSSMLASDETERLRRLNESQRNHITGLEEKLATSAYGKLKTQFTQMQKEKADEEEKSANLSSQVAKQEKKIQSLETKLTEKEKIITELEETQPKAESLQKELISAKAKIAENSEQQKELEKAISEMRTKTKELERVIQKQEQQLAESTRTNEELKTKIQVMSSTEATTSQQ